MARHTRKKIGLPMAYVLWWGIGSVVLYAGLGTAFDKSDDISASDRAIRFTPLRWTVRVDDLATADGLTFDALDISIPTTPPNGLRLSTKAPITVADELQTIVIEGDRVEGDLKVNYWPFGEVEKATVDIEDATVSGADVAIEALHMKAAQSEDAHNGYALSLDAANIELPQDLDLFAQINGSLSNVIESAHLEALAGLKRPLLIQSADPVIETLDIATATMKWDDIELAFDGKLTFEDGCDAQGQINLAVKGWQTFFDVAVEMEMIEPQVAQSWKIVGGNLADSEGRIALPLTLAGQTMRLGPFPLGPSPLACQRQ